MVKVEALIKLYIGENVRQTPFTNGYRPLFCFIEETGTSGQITLIGRESFFPGEEGIVRIAFLNRQFLGGDFRVGTKFHFGEGGEPLGEGEVVSIL
jgi:translation elongation factor EF-Tu-like GTPase